MRAVWMNEFGDPSVLQARSTPDPVPGEGQVIVEVAFANVTFVETQFRARGFGPFARELPVIPGNGVGGTLMATGRRVVSSTGGSGAYATRVAVDAAGVIDVPEGVGLDDATALLADGRTATWIVDAVAPAPEERVAVLAAAGGVGTLLVQLLAARGAWVIAAASTPSKLELARSLGAREAVVYDALPDGVDLVLDGVGGDLAARAITALRPGGRILTYGAASGSWTKVARDDVTPIDAPRPTPAQSRAFTEDVLAAAAAGTVRPVIGQRFPLERAAEAHAAIESRRTVGKTLLVA